ncbi:MAG TPA: LytTR family DNA-binding domain-containing protein [Chitinophagaceae bacterium]
MIRALIVDDETAASDVLQLMIGRYIPAITELRVANEPQEAIRLIEEFKPELVFLDIVMPLTNGFELLSQVQQHHFEVIFTTAYNEYAVKAIRFSALDYLLKPIDADELKAAVQRFITKQQTGPASPGMYSNLLHNLQVKEEIDFRLAIPTNDGARFVAPEELIRCEGERNYTWFFLTNNRKHLSSKTIKEYQDILEKQGFLRIHKSHLVNKKYVEYYLGEGAVLLKDKTRLPVSRQRKEEVMRLLGQ